MPRTRSSVLAILAAGAAIGLPALAEDAPERVPDLVQTFEVDAPVADVWAAFTTKEVAEKWMVPLAEFDLRSGGTMKTTYDEEAGIGGPGTIVHNLLAVVPERLLVGKTDAPDGNPFKESLKTVTGTWRFEPLGPARTRLHLGMHDWESTDDARRTRAFFETANPGVLEQLKKLFPDRESGAPVLEVLARLEGTWTHTAKARDGSDFHITNRVTRGPGETCFVMTTSFGPPATERLHKHTQVWLDKASGVVQWNALDERGGRVFGSVWKEGDATLVWQFEEADASGNVGTHRMQRVIESDDRHVFTVLSRGADGTYTPNFAVPLRAHRVAPSTPVDRSETKRLVPGTVWSGRGDQI